MVLTIIADTVGSIRHGLRADLGRVHDVAAQFQLFPYIVFGADSAQFTDDILQLLVHQQLSCGVNAFAVLAVATLRYFLRKLIFFKNHF